MKLENILIKLSEMKKIQVSQWDWNIKLLFKTNVLFNVNNCTHVFLMKTVSFAKTFRFSINKSINND